MPVSPDDLDRIAEHVAAVCRALRLALDSPERITVAQKLIEAFSNDGEAGLAAAVKALKKKPATLGRK